jgi:hypothetical protein
VRIPAAQPKAHKETSGESPRVDAILDTLPDALRFDKDPRIPLVIAVTPMTDVQTLDASSQYRRQRDFAFKLAGALQAAGFKAGAEAFYDYSRDLGRDAASVDAMPAVSTYSHSGGMVGFQIGPRFTAVGDPTAKPNSRNSTPSMRLERQRFPVLILMAIDQADLDLRFGAADNPASDDPGLVACEPLIRFQQFNRWLPLQGGSAPKESDANRLMIQLLQGREMIKQLPLGSTTAPVDNFQASPAHRRLIARLDTLTEMVAGSGQAQFLPETFFGSSSTALPMVTSSFPATVRYKPGSAAQTQTLLLLGSDLHRIKLVDVAEPSLGSVKLLAGAPDLLQLQYTPPENERSFVYFKFTLDGGQTTLSQPIALAPQSDPPSRPPPSITITRYDNAKTDADGKLIDSGEVTRTVVQPASPELIDLLRAMGVFPGGAAPPLQTQYQIDLKQRAPGSSPP